MTKAQMEAAIRDRFEPIPVISGSPKVQQLIRQAIMYFTKNYSKLLMRTVAVSDNPITLPADVGTVTSVYDVERPNVDLENRDIINYFFRTYYSRLSYSFEEMLALRTFYANTKDIFQEQMNWKFIRQIKAPHLLFLDNYRRDYVTIEFKVEFDPDDDTYDYTGFSEEWLYKYALVLVKEAEGEIIRKSESIDIPSDGQTLTDEARADKERYEEELRGKSRLFVV